MELKAACLYRCMALLPPHLHPRPDPTTPHLRSWDPGTDPGNPATGPGVPGSGPGVPVTGPGISGTDPEVPGTGPGVPGTAPEIPATGFGEPETGRVGGALSSSENHIFPQSDRSHPLKNSYVFLCDAQVEKNKKFMPGRATHRIIKITLCLKNPRTIRL